MDFPSVIILVAGVFILVNEFYRRLQNRGLEYYFPSLYNILYKESLFDLAFNQNHVTRFMRMMYVILYFDLTILTQVSICSDRSDAGFIRQQYQRIAGRNRRRIRTPSVLTGCPLHGSTCSRERLISNRPRCGSSYNKRTPDSPIHKTRYALPGRSNGSKNIRTILCGLSSNIFTSPERCDVEVLYR